MPLFRYFAYIGSVLLTLLVTLNWLLPPPDTQPVHSDIDRATIRIHSAHKWPSAVVLDTTLPTIVPPPATTAAAPAPPPPAHPAHEAFAMAAEPAPAAKPAEAVKPAKRQVRRTRTARAPPTRVESHDMFGFRNDIFAPPRREAFASPRNEGVGPRGMWPGW